MYRRSVHRFVVIALLVSPAWADPAPACDIGPYLTPTLFVVVANPVGFHGRATLGARVRDCTDAALDFRLGATAYVHHDHQVSTDGGFGAEAELGHRLSPDLVLGGRFSVETVSNHGAQLTSGAALFTFGARLHVQEQVALELDGFHRTAAPDYNNPYNSVPSATGVMLGVGFEGRGGLYTSAVAAGLGLLALAFLVAIAPGT